MIIEKLIYKKLGRVEIEPEDWEGGDEQRFLKCVDLDPMWAASLTLLL